MYELYACDQLIWPDAFDNTPLTTKVSHFTTIAIGGEYAKYGLTVQNPRVSLPLA